MAIAASSALASCTEARMASRSNPDRPLETSLVALLAANPEYGGQWVRLQARCYQAADTMALYLDPSDFTARVRKQAVVVMPADTGAVRCDSSYTVVIGRFTITQNGPPWAGRLEQARAQVDTAAP